MQTHYESQVREPLIEGNKDYHKISEDVCKPIEGKPTRIWYIGMAIATLLLLWGVYCVYRTVVYGIGEWNLNKTIGWGWDIIGFVWWVGIGHAGTLISSALLLFRQGWRTGVSRASEAMTIFAIMCAGMYPVFHMGRPWDMFGVFPYPNTRGPLWPNFSSPLLWDVFAITTYLSVSMLFWYSGLIPDFATVRDRAKNKIRKFFYGILSFGWTGSAKQWQTHEALTLILAGIGVPLVVSVCSIVSFDFATSVIPGWHATIFPPYFLSGALFCGFAMAQLLLILTRHSLNLKEYITIGHLEAMNKIVLLIGSIVSCIYITETFVAWYSGSEYEHFVFFNTRINWNSPYGWSFFGMMFCNVVFPQLFWFKKLRRNIVITIIVCIFVNWGMWFERFVIIVTSLYRDYLPSSWSIYYSPSWQEIGFYLGTFGLFFVCFFLFIKYFPVLSAFEIKSILKTSGNNFKEEMTKIESETPKNFVEETKHHS